VIGDAPMRAPRPHFRLRAVLLLVASLAVVIATGVRPKRVGGIYDATSMPGTPAFMVPTEQEGWLVGMIGSFLPDPTPDPSTATTRESSPP